MLTLAQNYMRTCLHSNFKFFIWFSVSQLISALGPLRFLLAKLFMVITVVQIFLGCLNSNTRKF